MKVEVSAIIEKGDGYRALAITPDGGLVFCYVSHIDLWRTVDAKNPLRLWNQRAQNKKRKIYRGIFTIEVK